MVLNMKRSFAYVNRSMRRYRRERAAAKAARKLDGQPAVGATAPDAQADVERPVQQTPIPRQQARAVTDDQHHRAAAPMAAAARRDQPLRREGVADQGIGVFDHGHT